MSDVYLSRYWVRKIDQLAIDDYAMSGIVLMENAGRGCAELLAQIGIQGTVVICCGRGNNGGDGFVVARHLDARGYAVKILLCCDPERLRGDAALNYNIAKLSQLSIAEIPDPSQTDWFQRELRDADWIVDALLGTGTEGEPRAPLDRLIPLLNAQSAKKFAVDLPSGLDCDTGRAAKQTFRADHTATFVAPKTGFRMESAKEYLGILHVLDIGVPRKLLLEVFGRVE